MKKITFTVFYCGMSEDLFDEKIMIYKPISNFSKTFTWEKNKNSFATAKELVDVFGNIAKEENVYLPDYYGIDSIYIRTDIGLIGLTVDKKIEDIYCYFKQELIDLVFFVVGGASLHCNGYLFIVHPNEDIHKNTPHVHVRRDDEETRYYLDSLERFENDKVSRRFLKDEKKIIKPFLSDNKGLLYKYWDMSINGYTTPQINEDGKQYYSES